MPKIVPEKFYTPTEIAALGVLSASNADTRRQMLLRFIREKRIEAVNLGGKKKPRYVVQGKQLLDYLDRQVKPEQIEKK